MLHTLRTLLTKHTLHQTAHVAHVTRLTHEQARSRLQFKSVTSSTSSRAVDEEKNKVATAAERDAAARLRLEAEAKEAEAKEAAAKAAADRAAAEAAAVAASEAAAAAAAAASAEDSTTRVTRLVEQSRQVSERLLTTRVVKLQRLERWLCRVCRAHARVSSPVHLAKGCSVPSLASQIDQMNSSFIAAGERALLFR